MEDGRKGRRWGKRIAVGVLLVMAALVVIALTYSWWLPAAARPIAQRYGISYGKYERLKDGRFALSGIVHTNRHFDLQVAKVEGFLPHVWRSRLGATNNETAFIEVNGWKVVVHETARRDRDGTGKRRVERSIYEEWERVEEYIAKAREWVPKATLLNGAVQQQGKEYTLSVATWNDGVLDASGVWPETAVPFEIKGKLTGEPPYQLSYAMNPLDLRTRLRVVETNGMLNAQLATFYKENRVDVVANFGPEGKLPLTATLKAPEFKLPGDLVKLDRYSEVSGSLMGEWKTNQYSVELKAHAEPLFTATNTPPADIEISATGDTNSMHVQRAVSTVPGLQLTVNQPLEISYQGRMLSERSEVKINADLEKLPWFKMKGKVQGTILLEKGGEFPKATFQAAGTNVSAFKVEAEIFQSEGKLDWPQLDDLKAQVRFASNSMIRVEGGGDLKSRVLRETVVSGEGPLLTNLLPENLRLGGMRVDARISGAITNLKHEGQVELRDFDAPQLQPLSVQASWRAQQITFDELALRARAGPAVIFVSGSGYAGGGRTNFVVREFRFLKNDEVYLQLSEPTRLTVTTNLEVELDRLVLLSPADSITRELELSAGLRRPNVAALEMRATNVNPALFQNFFERSLGGLDLEELSVSAGWSNSPLTGFVAGRFSVAEENFERLTAAIDVQMATNGILLRQLSIFNPESEICRAKGFLPVTITPLDLEKINVARSQEIDFQAQTVPNEAFWQTISRLTKVHLSNATVRLNVRGTTVAPTGELHVKADGLELQRTNRNLPKIGAFEGRIALNEQALTVPEFSLRVAEQPVTVSGELKLGENFWKQRREEIVQYALDYGTIRMVAPEVQLSPFTEYVPKYLRPQGKLFADIVMRPGRNFDGTIRVRGVETRPLERIGVVQDIEADVALQGKTVRIANLSGVFGGERLSMGGKIDLSAESVSKGYPDVDFSIVGYNIPLARNPDVILRSDLNLRVTNGPNRIPVVSGIANLRDSFLLRDISTLVPGRVARPERRPPYFSLEQDPIDEWRLNIRVRGENFMRVRSPFFQGVASANFQVTGSMVEPIALGEASISSGTVIFPFATLAVRQALVSLTSEHPYLPHIFVVASGRAFGFDVRMEAEGPADEPVIEFSSVPSLTSEQIILMLTTGQIPREDFGFSNEDRAGRLAFFLGKSLWSKLNPGQPAEERLTVRSGEDVTEQGRQTYEVEYKLNDRWSLVGEYNRFGDLNANVKWKVFSK
jgi:translocation and assembly module TamB